MRKQQEEEPIEEEEQEGVIPSRFDDDSLRSALMRQWGAAPWYVGSFGLHMLVFAILLLFAPDPQKQNTNKVKIEAADIEEEPEEEEPEPPEEEEIPEEIPEDVEVTNEITQLNTPDVEVDTTVENADPTEEESVTDVSDFATEVDYDTPITMGVNATYAGASSGGGKFSTRGARNKKGILKKHGVGKRQVRALDLALLWLAKVQEEDGHWDSHKYQGKSSDGPVTALALLAFLGDGNSSKAGKYKKTVRAAQEWLLSKNKTLTNVSYAGAVVTMALAEAWGMCEDESLRPVVQDRVDNAVATQSTTGGWGYYSNKTKDHNGAHVDTSVTGWWIMALKSSKLAGASVTDDCWKNATKYCEQGTFTEGSNIMSGYNSPMGSKNHAGNLTAVSLACLQFLGKERNDPLVRGQAQTLLHKNWIMGQSDGYDGRAKGGKTNYYGWYYQALGLFQYGTKSAEWKELEKRMGDILVDLQVKDGFNRGSFDPENGKDPGWGYETSIGRVGVTATACLILEVYYRFGNVHEGKH